MAHDQPANIEWRGKVPIATQFEDPYFSLENGLDETRHVFLAGNQLPQRFVNGFHIAELGFGTGLNFLAAWAAWRAAGVPGRLHFTSFEQFPMALADIEAALGAFPEVASLAEALIAGLEAGRSEFDNSDVTLTLIEGDARVELPRWQGQADAWFLDGFAPARNPELWEPELLAAVARHTKPGGTFATYTAAGEVRRDLAAAGFAVERVPGFGRKRHMTTGVLR